MTNNQNQNEQDEILKAQQSILSKATHMAKLGVATNGIAAGIAVGFVVLGLASAWWLIPAVGVAFVALSFHLAVGLFKSGHWDATVLEMAKQVVELSKQ